MSSNGFLSTRIDSPDSAAIGASGTTTPGVARIAGRSAGLG